MLIRIFLGIVSLSFLIFGAWALFDPASLAIRLGVEFGGANGMFEARGAYGGISLGAGALFAAAIIRKALIRPALWFLTAYMGGYVLARIFGLAAGDHPTADFLLFSFFEATCLAIAVIALNAYTPK